MSDETPVPGELAVGEHLARYRLDGIIVRGEMAAVYRAFLKSGSTPRKFAPEPGGTRLLVVDTDAGQVRACQIAQLP